MKRYFSLCIMFLGLITMSIQQSSARSGKDEEIKPIDKRNMDLNVKPGDNFFEYANGGWLKSHPIPPEYSLYGAFTQLQEGNYDKLKAIMDECSKAKKAKKGSIQQLIGEYYYAGMDTNNIDKLGMSPIEPYLRKIDEIRDFNDVRKNLSDMHKYGLNPMFSIYASPDETNSNMVIANLYQGGLGMHDRDYYLSEDKRSKELRIEYVKHLAKMFELIKFSSSDAKIAAEKIMNLETELAKTSRTRLELRDPQANYNKMDIEKLSAMSSDFNWKAFFNDMNITHINEINVSQPKFFEQLSNLIKLTPIEDWKIYLKWNLINGMANYLSKDFVNEHFHFYGAVFTGQEKLKDRWKRIMDQTSGELGEAVGQMYVSKFFPPSAKDRMIKLINNLKIALGERIKNLEWMGEATKKEALAKLAKINVKIGYPDKWIDYSSIDINKNSYLENSLRAGQFNVKRELEKIGKEPDRAEWDMTPQTVNAYYSPNMNEIVFPAAILQPPFFFLDGDDAVNYAAIGTVIGHEMTHGFDDQGRQYDKHGNLSDWWTKDDAEKFTNHVTVLSDQYDKFTAIDTFKVNGKLTLGENIADLGGITVSYSAFIKSLNGKDPNEKIDGFTLNERFFLSYAQVWRNNVRDKELMRRLREDVHSPGRFRVLGVLPNVPQFYETFKIKPGDKMYLPEGERAKIW